MAENFDLLGDPIPENFGGRGRPPHIPTQANRNKVRLLLAFGWTVPRIAAALRITGATLRKHYFVELRQKEEALHALEGNALHMVYASAAEGNVAAQKELWRLIEKHKVAITSESIGRAQQDETPRPPRPGKKEQAALDAQTAGEGSDWGDDLLAPTSSRSVN